jgi:hypothetical protein
MKLALSALNILPNKDIFKPSSSDKMNCLGDELGEGRSHRGVSLG